MRLQKTTLDGSVPVLLSKTELDRLFTKPAQAAIKKGGTMFISPEGTIMFCSDEFNGTAEPLAVIADDRRLLGRSIKKMIYSGKHATLKELRMMAGVTRDEMARAAHMPRATLESYEIGRVSLRRANYKRVVAIATLLGILPDELFLVLKED